MAQREKLQDTLRMARFARRYHSVLSLPQTVKRVAASAPSDDASTVGREWRRAQRVLRGAQGPVFRSVLTELDGVSAEWQATLVARLAQPYAGPLMGSGLEVSSGDLRLSKGTDSSDGDESRLSQSLSRDGRRLSVSSQDGQSGGVGGSSVVDERWTQRVESACRALKELNSATDPWVLFARSQCRSVTSGGRWCTLQQVAAVVPALRVAWCPLGGGHDEWTAHFSMAVEQLKQAVAPSLGALQHALQIQESINRACGTASAVSASWSALVEYLRCGAAKQILEGAMQVCGDERRQSQWKSTCADAEKQLQRVVSNELAAQAHAALLHCCVDTLVRTRVDVPQPQAALLLSAMRDARALVSDLDDALVTGAIHRARNAYLALHSSALRDLLSRGMEELLSNGGVNDLGVSSVGRWAGGYTQTESHLCDWALAALRYMASVQCELQEHSCADADDVFEGLVEALVVIVDDLMTLNRDLVVGGVAIRLYYDVLFLREVFKRYVTKRVEARVKLLYVRFAHHNPKADTQRLALWLHNDLVSLVHAWLCVCIG